MFPTQTEMDAEFECGLCHQIVVDPVVTPCHHLFCRSCLSTWLGLHDTCPSCHAEATNDAAVPLQTAVPLMWRMLLRIPNVRCRTKGCDFLGADYAVMMNHMGTQCEYITAVCPHSDLGCEFTGTRAALVGHATVCVFGQQAPILRRLNQLEAQVRTLQSEKEALQYRVHALEHRVAEANVWTHVANMRTPLRGNDAAIVACGAFVYVLGGRDMSGTFLADVERYDAEINSWQTVAPMTVGRAGHAAVECAGYIYVVGGMAPGPSGGCVTTGTMERYDPATETWTQMATLRWPTHRPAAAVSVAGCVAVPDCSAWYCPHSNAWTSIPKIPPYEVIPSCTVGCGDYILVLSPHRSDRIVYLCWYTFGMKTWQIEVSRDFDLPYGSYFCVACEQFILVVGSDQRQGQQRTSIHVLAPPMECFKNLSRCWCAMSAPPLLKGVYKPVVCRGYLYIYTPADGQIVRWPLPSF
jgi:hypothetical protein